MYSHDFVYGHSDRSIFPVLERWMRGVATALQGIANHSPRYFPFHDREVPGTSVLTAAAAMAGYYPVAEYYVAKIDRDNRRKRRPGRADLWFVAGEKCYSFEMKRAWDESSHAVLARKLSEATSDAYDIPLSEYDAAFGVLIAPVINAKSSAIYESFRGADYCFSVGVPDRPHVFIYFKEAC